MGGCFSRPHRASSVTGADANQDAAPALSVQIQSPATTQNEPAAAARPNTPLRTFRWKDKKRQWTADELRRERAAFWDTRLGYGGQRETWDVLKFVCNEIQRMRLADEGTVDKAQILATCQTSLDAAGINIPDGYLSNDVFDETGYRYSIPKFVICDPDNIIPEGGTSAMSTNDADYDVSGIRSEETGSGGQVPQNAAAGPNNAVEMITIKCRFSDTTNDVEVESFPVTGNTRELLKRLKRLRPTSDGLELKLIYFGKLLEKNQVIVEQGYKPQSVISVFVVPTS